MDFLQREELDKIHRSALTILSRAGILLDHAVMRQMLFHQGCRIKGRRVWLPEELVVEVLAQTPSRFVLYDRTGVPALTLGSGNRTAQNSGVVPRIYDLQTGQLRSSTRQDVVDTTRLLDALPRIGLVAATLVEPTDVLPEMTILRGFEAVLHNTTKPISGPGPTTATEARYVIQLGAAVREEEATALAERPFFLPWVCPASPLTYSRTLVEALWVCAEAGLPLAIVTNPIAGMTAPITLAGALAQMHAEILAAIVLTYQIRPGLPILYNGSFSVADMRTMAVLGGSPEVALAKATAVLLGKLCNLPVTGFGLIGMARQMDAQYGYEKASGGLLCALAGPDILSGLGNLATGMVTSYEALILEHELVGFLWRLIDGVQTDEEKLAVNVVCDLMEGKSLLTHPHTLTHLRHAERWQSALGQSLTLEEWQSLGRPEIVQRARDEVHHILDNHEIPSLASAVRTRMAGVMQEAEQVLCKNDEKGG